MSYKLVGKEGRDGKGKTSRSLQRATRDKIRSLRRPTTRPYTT